MKIVLQRTRRWLRQRYHSTIVATNGQVLYTSEQYVRRIDCERTAQEVADSTGWPIEGP